LMTLKFTNKGPRARSKRRSSPPLPMRHTNPRTWMWMICSSNGALSTRDRDRSGCVQHRWPGVSHSAQDQPYHH
jgi:hypothetical protein